MNGRPAGFIRANSLTIYVARASARASTSQAKSPQTGRNLAPEVAPDGALEAGSAFAESLGELLQVVAGRDAKLADQVLGSALEVAVVVGRANVLLGPAEVGVGRDGRRALEALQPRLRLGLNRRVEVTLAKELIRRNRLLRAELLARVRLLFLCGSTMLAVAIPDTRRHRHISLAFSDEPSGAALMGPTEPKPPADFFAPAAALFAPTWPKPRRPMPMPRRSISDADFSRVCDAEPYPPLADVGLTGVGERMPDPDADDNELPAFAAGFASSASGS